MKSNNQIECLEVSTEEILASQSSDIVSNKKALERIDYLKNNKFFVPDFTLDNEILKMRDTVIKLEKK